MSWRTSTSTSVSHAFLSLHIVATTVVGQELPRTGGPLMDSFALCFVCISGVAGSVYDLAASPSLADLLKNVSAQVPDPDREGKSLADPKKDGGDDDDDDDEEKLKVLDVAALGSGSGSSRILFTWNQSWKAGRLGLQGLSLFFLPTNRLYSVPAATGARIRQLRNASRTQGPGCAILSFSSYCAKRLIKPRFTQFTTTMSASPRRRGKPRPEILTLPCRAQSNFDSFHWQSTYGDPTYERHVAIARVLGLTAARLADDLVLPINITGESLGGTCRFLARGRMHD